MSQIPISNQGSDCQEMSTKLEWILLFGTLLLLDSGVKTHPQFVEAAGTTCDALIPNRNVDVSCMPPLSLTNTTTKCTTKQPIGTRARYKCHPFYVPGPNIKTPTLSEQSGEIQCSTNGSWIHLNKFRTFRCVEDCGRRLVNSKPLIINGRPTNSSSWPWHVALYRRRNERTVFLYICGGSLIRDNVVLTAAHCVAATDGKVAGKVQDYTAAVGATFSQFGKNEADKTVQIVRIAKIYISKHYDAKKDYNADIAIIHLQNPVRLNENVLPVCVPHDYALDSAAVKPGKYGDIIGFGLDETGTQSPILKHASLQIQSHATCFRSFNQILTESQLCAGSVAAGAGQNLITVCNGDSGGGLVAPENALDKYFIHGIVSSGGPLIDGTCQNYGVFTRVFQYVHWIRETLTEISGGESDQFTDIKYDYKLVAPTAKGGQIVRRRFIEIPREWDNRLRSVELTNVDLDPGALLESLQHTRTLRSLNMTRVNLDRPLTGRTRTYLPHLQSFALHDLREDLVVNTSLIFPIPITRSWVKSQLFFDKDNYDETDLQTWPVEKMGALGTNIELTVNIFKLIQIDHGQGIVALSRIPFSDEILRNLPSTLQLQRLALSGCEFDASILLQDRHRMGIRHLSLDNVNFTGPEAVTDVIRQLVNLETLNFATEHDPNRGMAVYLDQFPKSLQHLTLSRVSVKYSRTQPPVSRFYFENLHTFGCSNCALERRVVQEFHWTFQTIRRLILRTKDTINIKRLVDRMKQLTSVSIQGFGLACTGKNANRTSLAACLGERPGNFLGLDHFKILIPPIGPESAGQRVLTDLQDGTMYLSRDSGARGRGEWTLRQYTYGSPFVVRAEAQNFVDFGRLHFWTSFYETWERIPLTPTEVAAIKTGHYKFNGTVTSTSAKNLLHWRPVPHLTQTRIKTLEVSHAHVTPDALAQSLQLANGLESIVLDNVTLSGLFEKRTAFIPPSLRKYSLTRTVVANHSNPLSLVLSRVNDISPIDAQLFRLMFPFKENIRAAITRANVIGQDGDRGDPQSATTESSNPFLREWAKIQNGAYISIGQIPKAVFESVDKLTKLNILPLPDRTLDVASPEIYLQSQLKEVDIVQGRCRLFRMNKTITGSNGAVGGELLIAINVLNEVFEHWNQSAALELSQSNRSEPPPLIKLSVSGQSLHSVLNSVPRTIRHLNLQNIPPSTSSAQINRFIGRQHHLEDLTLIQWSAIGILSIFFPALDFPTPTVSLSAFRHNSARMKHLNFYNTRFKYTAGIRFGQLTTLSFLNCHFEDEVGSHFGDIFLRNTTKVDLTHNQCPVAILADMLSDSPNNTLQFVYIRFSNCGCFESKGSKAEQIERMLSKKGIDTAQLKARSKSCEFVYVRLRRDRSAREKWIWREGEGHEDSKHLYEKRLASRYDFQIAESALHKGIPCLYNH